MSLPRTPLAPDSSEIQQKLQRLASAAQTLNQLSDELTKHVADIEACVNKLNVGVTATVKVEQSTSEDGMYSTIWRLAYEKTSKQWGFVLERLTEDLSNPETDTYESWPFKDAPREYRVRAVEKIPALLDALIEKSKQVESEVSGRVSYAKSLALSLGQRSTDGGKK